ncbi:MAG: glycosyltransferase family 4 protein [Pseudomonadota bacterium]
MKDALDTSPPGGPDAAAQPDGGPLRILVSSYRSNPHVGGQGVYVRELTRALSGLGHSVSVASGPPYPELDAGIELIELPSLDLFSEDNAMLALRWRHLINRADRYEWIAHNTGAFAEMTSFALRLEAFLEREGDRFDVVHDNQTLAMPMTRIDQRMALVTTLHHPIAVDRGFAIAGASTLLGKLLARRWHSFIHVQARAAKRLKHFLSVSDSSRQGYGALCGVEPSCVDVAFNGIDHDAFYEDPSTAREPGLIAAVASADVPIKGLDVLIAALAQLNRADWRLVVVGALRDGPTRQALQRHGLLDRVEFRSGLAREAVAQLFRQASLFVSPSRFEGFGFPPAEAMACGAPVIVSDGGALPEVAGDAGIVTPVEDASVLAAAINRLLDDPDERMRLGALGAERARTQFCWRKHGEAAVRLHRRAIGALTAT